MQKNIAQIRVHKRRPILSNDLIAQETHSTTVVDRD